MSWRNLDYPGEIEEAAIEWRLKVSEGALTLDEQIAFDAWRAADPRHEDAYEQAVSMWEALGTLGHRNLRPALFEDVTQDHQKRFLPNLLETFARQPRQSAQKWAQKWAVGGAMAIAASFAIVFSIQVWMSGQVTVEAPAVVTAYASQRGEVKTITLPDQSVITLGAATALEVAMSETERRVTLSSGAAVFDVTSNPDKPFIVEAGDFTATVRGTVFDVRSSGGVVRLSVAEGEVEVAHPLVINDAPTSMVSRKSVTAGKQISANASEGLNSIEDLKQEDFASWRDARLRYKSATLAELITDANRYSQRKIVLSDALAGYTGDRATLIFDGNDVDRLLKSLPVLFPVIVEDSGSGDVLISALPEEK